MNPLLVMLAGLASPPAAPVPTVPDAQSIAIAPPVIAVTGVAITVADLDRSLDFFTRVLPFERIATEELGGDAVEHLEGVFGARLRVATLRLGAETIELREFVAGAGRPFPADSKGNDLWFQHVAIVVSDMAAAHARLASHGVTQASPSPQVLPQWNASAAGIEAFYFRDPDLHWLELIRFPPGKGDPRWQDAAGGAAPFLGIDHTAIVVDDTESALGFWRDQIGLSVAGGSENHGVEQEHLNAVFGARLRITTLRAPRGIGVELLDYLSPSDGRPAPADLRAGDVSHWWTLLETADTGALDAIAARTRERHPLWVSPGPIELPRGRRAFTLRDPDRHGVELQTSAISTNRDG